eukprot:m51a1_g5532 hypothetical protein (244) ;mRNA; r:452338-453832
MPHPGALAAALLLLLLPLLAACASAARVPLWVSFDDKNCEAAVAAPTPHALARRSRGPLRSPLAPRSPRGDVDAGVCPGYAAAVLEALPGGGVALRGTSRWLNAASYDVDEAAAEPFRAAAEALPFVKGVWGVLRSRSASGDVGTSGAPAGLEKRERARATTAIDYGESLAQLEVMNVPQAHARGANGTGVVVALLDSGFHTDHPGLAGTRVLHRWDFVQNDSDPSEWPVRIPNGLSRMSGTL